MASVTGSRPGSKEEVEDSGLDMVFGDLKMSKENNRLVLFGLGLSK